MGNRVLVVIRFLFFWRTPSTKIRKCWKWKRCPRQFLNVALFVTSSLLVKKSHQNQTFFISFFLAHVTKYKIYLLYFSLLDQEQLWQTFTTDKYICVIWRKNEQSIIEVCNKIQKLRKSLSFFISCTISRKNWPNIFIYFFRFLFKLVRYLN